MIGAKPPGFSASMEVAPVRVKLLFNNLPIESFWVLVKSKKYSKVKDFLAYVKRKFIPQSDGFLSVLVNGAKVPEWEKSSIFREDDIVHLDFKEESVIVDRVGEPLECENVEIKEKEIHKKKKKKSKEELELNVSKDKTSRDSSIPRFHDDHSVSKKRKIPTDIQETVQEENVESKDNADKEKESVAPKRKRIRKRKNRKEDTKSPVPVFTPPVSVKPLKQYADQANNMHIKFSSDNEEESCSATASRIQNDFLPQQDTMKYRTSTPDYQAEEKSTVESRDFTYNGKSPLTAEKPNMTQSVLANGVTVFSRPRSRQIKTSSFRELSKIDQLSTTLTNRSIVLQNTDQSNGVENQSYTSMDVTDSHHKGNFSVAIPVYRDYSRFPLLQGNPSPGEKIAFKILEMSEDYTPEVGDYKEAEVIGFNSSSQIVELKIIPGFLKERKMGKFDVDFGDEEGEGDKEEFQAHPLTSLMEVRLITD